MEQLGKKLDRTAFLKGANNGSIQPKVEEVKKEPAKKTTNRHFILSFEEPQKQFIDELVEATGITTGKLILQAILFNKNEPISLDFLNEHINFIYSKGKGKSITVQNPMLVHESLKNLSKHYKDAGYNIGNKGVVLLYLLNYAKHFLNQDISRFNFDNFIK